MYKCKDYLFYGPNGLFVPPYFFRISYLKLKTHMHHDCEFNRCIFNSIITPLTLKKVRYLARGNENIFSVHAKMK